MAHQKPTGSFVALITPMNADGSIDYEGFRTLIDWHAENGTSALLIMGSTGEVSMLTPEERQEIVRRTLAMRRPGMTMWYGCTGNNTDATIAQVRFAAAEGADGAIVAAPSYICADNDAIEAYMAEVLDSADLAMGFYNNPPRVKTDLHWSNLLRLAEHPNMVVLKESTTRVGQVAQVCAAQPDMSIMCCCSPNLGLVVPTMALGGHGTANMTGNLIPREMAVISTPWKTGEDAFACRAAWLENLPVLHFAYSAINPVAVKTLMRAMGMPAGPLRRPLQPLAQPAVAEALEMMSRLGLDKRYGFRTGATALTAAE
ncbi:dihydrodipicolinate synthase family protein [Jannaschia seohaensis]|uniref:4-hydroxy-tetrahydrodipicolinate synthase n=1 Tax=Jannaschia seohaensis TaxID=475081 RepID=A0A2Y9B4X4_9RHOB|nr:dihydrodipicolinate synthase family protein [Jannaschia seohaensis]PWJ11160.1 4-hydroxy-tetrahydrodipicolinate synthase [Jannaschia seohaensis]SSA51461.1 4-hydroxy-tetrahydrodipicolinate synthase [Jannaschia seohaensis]